jgi:signal transduction histidine kinase
LRLIKEKTSEYESFHKSLQYFTKQSAARGDLKLISFENHRINSNLFEKYSFFVQNVSSFQKRIQSIESVIELNSIFQEFVKKIIFSKEVEIFLFNDSRRNLIPLNTAATQPHIAVVNKAYKDGILDWIFETKKATIIPDLNLLTINGSKLNQIIFPIYDRKTNYGLLSILTPVTKVQDDSLENQSVQILLSMIIPMIINLRQKQSINKLYQELQVYQSKMKNDFDTYAIGELAQGILEEIGEPLQVILSYTNDIENEQTVDNEVTDKIKQQVKKISDLAERLVKFSGLNKPQPQKSQPCEINKVLREFINVIKTTLDNLGLECELDLEENMPPVLSDPKDIKQMLTSIFSIIKSDSKKGGAIVIQTKYIKEKIVLSVFTTEQLLGLSNPEEYNSNITIKLINELMKKNEGVVEFNSLPLKGTIIHLIFPMKRKLNL